MGTYPNAHHERIVARCSLIGVNHHGRLHKESDRPDTLSAGSVDDPDAVLGSGEGGRRHGEQRDQPDHDRGEDGDQRDTDPAAGRAGFTPLCAPR